VEMGVGVAVALVVLAISIPYGNKLSDQYRLRGAVGQIKVALHNARAQASEENAPVTVAFVGGTNVFGVDTSEPRDGVPDDVRYLPRGIELGVEDDGSCLLPPGLSTTITFNSRGNLVVDAAIPNATDCTQVESTQGMATVAVSSQGQVTVR